jgi:hypothetical protein
MKIIAAMVLALAIAGCSNMPGYFGTRPWDNVKWSIR